MQVFLQTRLTPLSSVYDTDAPASGSGMGKAILNWLKPYARVQEGNVTLYEMGKPYPDESSKYQFLIGLGAAALLLSGVGIIFGLGRMSK